MKAATFEYVAADSVEAAVAALAEHGDEGKVLAGGQSLVPLLNMRLALPSVVIDIGRVAELKAAEAQASGAVRYGAGTIHARFEDGLVPDPTGGLLHHVAAGIGYRAIRNKGTVGGSLAHADASAEWPVVMAALDATVVARSARGERRIPAREMVQGYFTSALEPDELLVAVEVSALGPDARWGFCKSARKPGEFAESLAVALVRPTGTEVWLGAAREVPVPVALPGVTSADGWDPARSPEVATAVADALGPADPDDPDGDYHHHLAGVTAGRAIRHALTDPAAQETQP